VLGKGASVKFGVTIVMYVILARFLWLLVLYFFSNKAPVTRLAAIAFPLLAWLMVSTVLGMAGWMYF
jgi:uncharacterized membrane protein (GlpM family)